MATTNKFSNPDIPAGDCLRFYADCLIIKPLQAVFCLPCVCCAMAHKNHEEEREIKVLEERGKMDREKTEGTIEGQPSQQPDMTMLPDASKPRDQWPAEWHSGYDHHADQVKRGAKSDDAAKTDAGGEGDKTIKDKLADGVLKIATAG
ncbi:hypothetical protein F4679DRAFT_127286 [Xylaria curta]|nr:hypothetical protein F4679DRAFT_127286 [Xylaria curta]